jgi:drug/metabolite transporter (DMT)-like permease
LVAVPAQVGVLVAVVLWGVSFVVTKFAVAQISPTALILARGALGATFLAGLLAARKEAVVPPRDALGGLALMGFVGVAFHQMLQAIALTSTSAVNAGWLIALTPIWSALFAVVRLHERLPRHRRLGMLLGFAGAVLVITRGQLAGVLNLPTTRGDLLILASTLNWAFYSTLGHPIIRRLGPTHATLGAFAFGTLFLLPLLFLSGAWRDYARLSASGWAAVLFLGIGCSGLGYLFWYAALAKLEASRVAAFLYVEPLVTLVTAAVLLGETISLWTIAGGALLLVGVALVQRT